MESDPQVLVALAASSIEKIASPAACTSPVHTVLLDHDTLPVLVTSSTAGGIGTIPAAPTFPANNSIADKYKVDGAVLDAFASISITNTASQCVAVALEIDVLQHVAVLTIASKYPIAPDLIAYLNGIWRLMSVISKRCEQLRQQVDLTAPMGVRLPISINAAIEPWKSELVKRVYLYCEGKDMRLLQSRWGNLRPFVLRFEPRQDTLSGDSILQRKLTDGIFALGATYRLLQTLAYAQDLPDAQWRDLSCLMDGTVSDIGTVLDDRSLCEQWSREKGYDPKYPLRQVLDELITQHRHILVLLRFSQSSQSHPALCCKLTIRAVPCQSPVPISLPSTALCCQSLIESVCGESLITDYPWLFQESLKFRDRCNSHSNSSSGSTSVTHTVCALIAFLEMSASISHSDFSYLGTSSLTCAACHSWIQAFNSLGGREYGTRGTNGDWHFLWAMPELALATAPQKVKLSAHMVKHVAAEYVAFWTSKGKLYSLTDCPPDATGIVTNTTGIQDPATRREELVANYRQACLNGRW